MSPLLESVAATGLPILVLAAVFSAMVRVAVASREDRCNVRRFNLLLHGACTVTAISTIYRCRSRNWPMTVDHVAVVRYMASAVSRDVWRAAEVEHRGCARTYRCMKRLASMALGAGPRGQETRSRTR